jgi:hypothetical protein
MLAATHYKDVRELYESSNYGMWREVGIFDPGEKVDWWRNMLTDQVSELQITGDMHAALAPVLVDVEEQSPEALIEQIDNASDDQIIAYGDTYYSGVPMQGLQGLGAHLYNNPDYKWYVAWWWKGEKSPIYIDSGWEYKEDAQERLEAFKEEVALAHQHQPRNVVVKVYSRKSMIQRGADPGGEGGGFRWEARANQWRPPGTSGLGRVTSVNYGQIPGWPTFKRHYKRVIGTGRYQLELMGTDADVARHASAHAMTDEDYFEYSVAGKDVYSMNDKQLYAFVQELASLYRSGAMEGGERYRMLGDAAGHLAVAILATLGFEWV